ncbi:MAG: hypothetical protein ABR555_11545 [Pyrinomonadaceae bacterium]
MNLLLFLPLALILSVSNLGYSQDTEGQSSRKVDALLAKLSSDDDVVRYDGLRGLSSMGQVVVPTIQETIKKQSGYVTVYAARVLLNIEPENTMALKALAQIARNKQERKEVRRYASYVMVLSSVGINTLAGMLKDEDVFVRRSAAFAFEEAVENGEFLPPGLKPLLYNCLPLLALALADEDRIVSGVSAETFEQILNKDVPALNEAAKNSNAKLRNAALAVLKRRQSGHTSEGFEADAKPAFEEAADRNPMFMHGPLGLIRALRMGGEPVRDYRSIPDSTSPFVLHMVLKPSTRKMSLRKNQFNPYEDLK